MITEVFHNHQHGYLLYTGPQCNTIFISRVMSFWLIAGNTNHLHSSTSCHQLTRHPSSTACGRYQEDRLKSVVCSVPSVRFQALPAGISCDRQRLQRNDKTIPLYHNLQHAYIWPYGTKMYWNIKVI
jgi:hypothetical protein